MKAPTLQINTSHLTLLREQNGVKTYQLLQNEKGRVYSLPETKNLIDFAIRVAQVYYAQTPLAVDTFCSHLANAKETEKTRIEFEATRGLSEQEARKHMKNVLISACSIDEKYHLQLQTDLLKDLDELANENGYTAEDFQGDWYYSFSGNSLAGIGGKTPLPTEERKMIFETSIVNKCNEVYKRTFLSFFQKDTTNTA